MQTAQPQAVVPPQIRQQAPTWAIRERADGPRGIALAPVPPVGFQLRLSPARDEPSSARQPRLRSWVPTVSMCLPGVQLERSARATLDSFMSTTTLTASISRLSRSRLRECRGRAVRTSFPDNSSKLVCCLQIGVLSPHRTGGVAIPPVRPFRDCLFEADPISWTPHLLGESESAMPKSRALCPAEFRRRMVGVGASGPHAGGAVARVRADGAVDPQLDGAIRAAGRRRTGGPIGSCLTLTGDGALPPPNAGASSPARSVGRKPSRRCRPTGADGPSS